ncbi:hypothetical protein DID78_06320 [Candidatus Marinamargulisbacteria bacterium SCGC AG-343-D04]|nr:hypothetical protein DID78_06320 [Candidatus Marinamargulisbacteria bacterium SCGC AG-343-D04]
MSNLQYECIVNNNKVTKEEGSFFKAAPFSVTVDSKRYDINFTRNEKGHVVYEFLDGDKLITSVRHPDYVPECSAEELNTTLNHPAAQALFAATCKCDVSIEKDYKAFFASDNSPKLSFHIQQHSFL